MTARLTCWLATTLFLLALSACGSDSGPESCEAGTVGCPCLEDESCLFGMNCIDAVCQVGGESDGGPDAEADTGTEADLGTEDDTGGADVPDVGVNACGGTSTLAYDDAPSAPGTECGCGGILICNGPDALRCAGDRPENSCGGCAVLPGTDGESCGPCGDGVWECVEGDPDGITCAGAAEPNGCGGCDDLGARQPAWRCAEEEFVGTYVCAGPNRTDCVEGARNACGGFIGLVGKPGSPCGACGLGVQVCDGTDALTCDESAAPENACGGCAPLPGEPGEPCGECGTWTCDATDSERVVCVESRNTCGGCDDLRPSFGAACAEGLYHCDGTDATACGSASLNACGGESTLSAQPGEPCGDCLDGVVQCMSAELVACVGGTPENECGGCGILPGVPGELCGEGAEWECREDGVLDCVINDPRNACGGRSTLEGVPGAGCPEDACTLSRYVCTGEDFVICEGQTNVCGGCNPLTDPADGELASPNDRCGTCDSGELRCDGLDGLFCLGDGGADEYIPIYYDGDGDGWGDPETLMASCDDDVEDYVTNDRDCDDTDSSYSRNSCAGCTRFAEGEGPGFTCGTCGSGRFVCDGTEALLCEGDAGDGARITIYRDADGDGRGAPGVSDRACREDVPDGWVTNAFDTCDDDNPADEGTACTIGLACGSWECGGDALVCNTSETPTWFRDRDGDGYGVSTDTVRECTDDGLPPDGYSARGAGIDEDCDDGRFPSSALINPGAEEIPGDGVDQDCDGAEICFVDADGDGWHFGRAEGTPTCSEAELRLEADLDGMTIDCDDSDNVTYPGADELCDGLDNDCDRSFVDDGNGEESYMMACNEPGSPDQCRDGVTVCGTTIGGPAEMVCDGDEPTPQLCTSSDTDCNPSTGPNCDGCRYLELTSGDYVFCTAESQHRTRVQAMLRCDELYEGSQLAVLNDEDELETLRDELRLGVASHMVFGRLAYQSRTEWVTDNTPNDGDYLTQRTTALPSAFYAACEMHSSGADWTCDPITETGPFSSVRQDSRDEFLQGEMSPVDGGCLMIRPSIGIPSISDVSLADCDDIHPFICEVPD